MGAVVEPREGKAGHQTAEDVTPVSFRELRIAEIQLIRAKMGMHGGFYPFADTPVFVLGAEQLRTVEAVGPLPGFE